MTWRARAPTRRGVLRTYLTRPTSSKEVASLSLAYELQALRWGALEARPGAVTEGADQRGSEDLHRTAQRLCSEYRYGSDDELQHR